MESDRWHHADEDSLARGLVAREPGALQAFCDRYRDILASRLSSAVRRDGQFGVSLAVLAERGGVAACRRFLEWPGSAIARPGLADFLRQFRIEDLVLAIACSKGSEPAWEVFDTRFARFIRGSVERFAKHPGDVREIIGGFYADLFLPQTDGGNTLARFEGRSTLRTWLRAILFYRVKDHYARGRRALVTNLIDPEGVGAFAGSPGEAQRRDARVPPSVRFHSRDLGGNVRAALRRSLDALSSEDREILEEYYFRRRTVIEIGRDRRVHKASVSRWLKGLRSRLLRSMKRDLGADFPGTAEEVEQLLEALREDASENEAVGA